MTEKPTNSKIEEKIKQIYKENKDKVPAYLDQLKEEKQMTIKEASYDNDYLKHML